ncbi:hypothetical protein QPL79_06320 [Ignisphaera sp. 4213-co]|uniref:Uncharacterized protein n=1 Tax=Ignisphaera cupida TaxID=3050454 RepID=A0ABD4Z764_9CREN|nr:hypothetical protein [Ignisphaera sp. 4213-co]MDK6028974.1 hypothetical protein [Ignisphaera sp. 4213-co]
MTTCKTLTCITLCLAVLLLVDTATVFVHGAETFVEYSYVISNWFGWVVKLSLNAPKIFEIGSTSTLNFSIQVLEKGSGLFLSITNLDVSLGSIRTSSYVGLFNDTNKKVFTYVSIPVAIDTQVKPGSIITSSLVFSLSGYIMFSNGTRKQVSFSQSIPVTLFTPLSPVFAYVDAFTMDNSALLQIRLVNFDAQPIYRVYASIYINSTLYKTEYFSFIKSNSSETITQLVLLSPGIYVLRVNVSYVTSYGIPKSFATSTRVVIPLRPNIAIWVNTSRLNLGQKVLIKGCINPRTVIGIALEYSLNGVSWNQIAFVESNNTGCFQYIWKVNKATIVYVRARNVETELYREATSNVITLEVSKLKPVIKILSNNTLLRVGDSTRIQILIEPPMSIPITILYREGLASKWINYTSLKTNGNGVAYIPTPFFSKPGTYIFKAIAAETDETEQSESNELVINVYQIQQNTNTQTTQETSVQIFKGRLDVFKIAMVIALSIALSLLLYASGRKKPG